MLRNTTNTRRRLVRIPRSKLRLHLSPPNFFERRRNTLGRSKSIKNSLDQNESQTFFSETGRVNRCASFSRFSGHQMFGRLICTSLDLEQILSLWRNKSNVFSTTQKQCNVSCCGTHLQSRVWHRLDVSQKNVDRSRTYETCLYSQSSWLAQELSYLKMEGWQGTAQDHLRYPHD